jgi:hypothetical protein
MDSWTKRLLACGPTFAAAEEALAVALLKAGEITL